MARSIRTGSRPLASGALGYHVLDTLMAMDESVASGRTVDITSAPSMQCPSSTRTGIRSPPPCSRTQATPRSKDNR
jgi:hypothetical protein